MKFSSAAIVLAVSSTQSMTMSSVQAFQPPITPSFTKSSSVMTELKMSNNNNHNSFWGSAVSAWAGITIATQVATAMPPQQQYQSDVVIWKETPTVITAALGSGNFETMDFSMPSYSDETKGGVKPKAGADIPSFNPFGDFEPKIIEGGDNTEAKRAEAEAKKAEEKASREAAKAEAEARKAEEKAAREAAREAAKAEAEAKKAEEKAAREAAKEEAEAKKAEEKSASDLVKSADLSMPSIEIPEFKAPDIKMPDVTIPDFKVPDIKMPDLKKPDITIPDFKASMADIKAPEITMPDFKKLDMPKVDMPKVPSFSVPSFGEAGGSSDVFLESQEVRDERAREARQVFLEADKEAKAAEAAAREVRKAANEKKNMARTAKDEACKTRLGGKFLCLRNPFTAGY